MQKKKRVKIRGMQIRLFPKTEVDFKIMKLKEKWEESEKGHLASQYIKMCISVI